MFIVFWGNRTRDFQKLEAYVSICYLAKNLKFAPKTSMGLLTQVLKFVFNDSFLNESLVLFRN